MYRLAQSPVQRWFLTAVRRYPGQTASVVVLSVLTSLADGLSISLLIPLLTILFDHAPAANAHPGAIERAVLVFTSYVGADHQLLAVSCAMVGLITFRTVVGGLYSYLSHWISGRISCDIRATMHENLLRADYAYVSLQDGGRLLNTLDAEAWRATEAITTYLGLFTSLCMATVLSSLLLGLSWLLTLVVVLSVLVVSFVMLAFDRRLRGIGGETLSAGEDLYERAVELFAAMRMTRAYGREAEAQHKYETTSRRLFELSMRRVRMGDVGGGVQEVLHAVTFVLTIFSAVHLQVSGAVLITYLALLHRLQPHLRAIDRARMQLASLNASVGAVSELLALPHWHPSSPTALVARPLQHSIRFEQVSFSYAGKDGELRTALQDVNLELLAGRVTAVIGWSGAGKSTLTNLLFRFYDPCSGSISVDGVPLPQVDLSSWRSQLAIAGQDADLVGGTIRENIACGRAGATFEEIVDAARRASAHDFIVGLPRGYETRVGSRGTLLSGGQRQRIGLARALMRRGGILVLDEATNALDSMTEEEILRSLEGLRGQTTVLVIAHRLSTVRQADHVIALAHGRVVEAGSPSELARQGGFYSQMLRFQNLDREDDSGNGLTHG